MKNSEQKRTELKERLSAINGIVATQEHEESNSIGITFEYLNVLYTAYCDAYSEECEVLMHDSDNIASTQNVGSVQATELISFFSSLPKIEDILK